MALLRAVATADQYPLAGKVTVIGRDPACDIVLPARQVSGRHALIVNTGAAYFAQDLDSVNGTCVNGERIRGRVRLNSGDRIDVPGLAVLFIEEATDSFSGDQHTLRPEDVAVEEPPSVLSSLSASDDERVQVAPEAKLRAVLEIAKNLGTSLDLKEVLPKILDSLFTIFPHADRGFILLRDPVTGVLGPRAVQQRRERSGDRPTFSRTIVNYALQTGRAILTADAGSDERFGISESIRQMQLRSVMCVPLLSQSGAGLGAIQIDTTDRRNTFKQEDLDVLVSAGAQAARAVEVGWLHAELRDLEAAKEIQKSFLPERRPRVPGLRFFDYYSAARHVSGDYYDYIELPGNRLAVALGDVSGKGVPAALLMARLSAAVRFCLATAPRVADAVRHLSAVLTRVGAEDRFITFVVCLIDLNTFQMTIVNAGHMAPLRRQVTKPGVGEVGAEEAGLPLAVLDKPYEEVVVSLDKGDNYILYTDGVTEARNPTNDFYGPERLLNVITRGPTEVEALGQCLIADVNAFSGERPQADDITVVCFGRDL